MSYVTRVSDDEWAIIAALRDLPTAPLREELLHKVLDLLALSRDARCPEAQADGVPCTTVDGSCDDCARGGGRELQPVRAASAASPAARSR